MTEHKKLCLTPHFTKLVKLFFTITYFFSITNLINFAYHFTFATCLSLPFIGNTYRQMDKQRNMRFKT